MAFLALEDEKYEKKIQAKINTEMNEKESANAIRDLFLGLQNGNKWRNKAKDKITSW